MTATQQLYLAGLAREQSESVSREAIDQKGLRKQLLRRLRARPSAGRVRSSRGGQLTSAIRPAYRGQGRLRRSGRRIIVQLPRNLSTKSELRNSLRLVGRQIRKNGKSISAVNRKLKQLDKQYKDIGKNLAKQAQNNAAQLTSIQLQQMFNALLPPKLKDIEFEPIEVEATIEWDAKAMMKIVALLSDQDNPIQQKITDELETISLENPFLPSRRKSSESNEVNLAVSNENPELPRLLVETFSTILGLIDLPLTAKITIPGEREISSSSYDTIRNLILGMLPRNLAPGSNNNLMLPILMTKLLDKD